MILTWPANLPRPNRDGYQRKRQDGRRATQPDAGPMRFRRRYSNVATEVQLQLTLTRPEKAVFDRFFEDDTAGGAHLFWMPDPTTDGWQLLTHDDQPILTHTGEPILIAASWLCSFGAETPTEVVEGTRFRISFPILVMP